MEGILNKILHWCFDEHDTNHLNHITDIRSINGAKRKPNLVNHRKAELYIREVVLTSVLGILVDSGRWGSGLWHAWMRPIVIMIINWANRACQSWKQGNNNQNTISIGFACNTANAWKFSLISDMQMSLKRSKIKY